MKILEELKEKYMPKPTIKERLNSVHKEFSSDGDGIPGPDALDAFARKIMGVGYDDLADLQKQEVDMKYKIFFDKEEKPKSK